MADPFAVLEGAPAAPQSDPFAALESAPTDPFKVLETSTTADPFAALEE